MNVHRWHGSLQSYLLYQPFFWRSSFRCTVPASTMGQARVFLPLIRQCFICTCSSVLCFLEVPGRGRTSAGFSFQSYCWLFRVWLCPCIGGVSFSRREYCQL